MRFIAVYISHLFNSGSSGCGSGEWECADGQCINEDYLCDGQSDCNDDSDESSSQCGGGGGKSQRLSNIHESHNFAQLQPSNYVYDILIMHVTVQEYLYNGL